MPRKFLFLFLLSIALPCHAEGTQGQRGVLAIQSVETVLNLEAETSPAIRELMVTVTAEVNTGGWSNGHLVPVNWDAKPADGIYDLIFRADPPKGFAPMVLSPLEAFGIFPDAPLDIKGVRIIPGGPGEPLVCGVPATCP